MMQPRIKGCDVKIVHYQDLGYTLLLEYSSNNEDRTWIDFKVFKIEGEGLHWTKVSSAQEHLVTNDLEKATSTAQGMITKAGSANSYFEFKGRPGCFGSSSVNDMINFVRAMKRLSIEWEDLIK